MISAAACFVLQTGREQPVVEQAVAVSGDAEANQFIGKYNSSAYVCNFVLSNYRS